MLTRRTVITAIAEATYGTDPVMSGTNAILAWDVNPEIKGDVLERVFLRDTLTNMAHVVGKKQIEVSFKTEIVGSNAAPMIAPLLTACGFGTGVTSGTAITYSLQSTEINMPSVSLYIYKDGNRHKVTGARGTVKLSLEAGKYGVAEWKFNGLYNAVEAVALPDISGLSVNKPPICYNSSFVIGAFSPVTSKLDIDLNNTVAASENLNAATGFQYFRIAERKPNMKFDADAVVEASNPFWGDYVGSVVKSFGAFVGTSANGYVLSGFYELAKNDYADKDGILKYNIEANLVGSTPDTQNDELSIKFLIG